MSDKGAWPLESFVDSLSLELDKVYDTLAVKGVNRPLAFSVKELAMDLYVFPSFDGRTVRFKAAESGDMGASKLTIQLGSITREQIRRTAPKPITMNDIAIEDVDDLDEEVRQSLKKHGVKSTRDLINLEEKNLDLDTIVNEKPGSKKTTYKNLADKINRARRKRLNPQVAKVSFSKQTGTPVLEIEGSNLAVINDREVFPLAVINGEKVPVLEATDKHLCLQLEQESLLRSPSKLQIALDPFAIIKMNLRAAEKQQRETRNVE